MLEMKYLLFILVLFFAFCKTDNTTPTITSTDNITEKVVRKDISVTEAHDWLKSDNAPILIDVRTPKEYAEGHIAGSTMIDYQDASFDDEIAKLDKDQTYLIYCRSGGRSGNAVHKMIGLGFTDVTNMEGGYNAWSTK